VLKMLAYIIPTKRGALPPDHSFPELRMIIATERGAIWKQLRKSRSLIHSSLTRYPRAKLPYAWMSRLRRGTFELGSQSCENLSVLIPEPDLWQAPYWVSKQDSIRMEA
jgi:hypothetical protein